GRRRQLPRQRRPVPGHARRHGDEHAAAEEGADHRAVHHADRAPRGQRLPARAHAGRLRAGHHSGRRLHRAGRRGHQGRPAGRPPRERDRRHHRRLGAPGVRRPAHHQGDRRPQHHRLVHRGLHPGRAAHPAGRRAPPAGPRRQHQLRRALPGPHVGRGRRPGAALAHGRRPPDRRLPRDQAPHLLRRPRVGAGGPAGRRPRGQRLRRRRRPGRHPELRDRQPAAALAAHRPAAGPAGRLRGCSVRPRELRRPAHLRRPGDGGGPGRDQRLRRRRGALQGRDDPARLPEPARRADRRDPRRAPGGAQRDRLDVPAGEPVPAGRLPARHRPDRSRGPAAGDRDLSRRRHGRLLHRQPRRRRPGPAPARRRHPRPALRRRAGAGGQRGPL
ncbi:MAG: Glycerophosphoryl diester phosphodiesterase, partial [uncultured Friedmanniella sp.]